MVPSYLLTCFRLFILWIHYIIIPPTRRMMTKHMGPSISWLLRCVICTKFVIVCSASWVLFFFSVYSPYVWCVQIKWVNMCKVLRLYQAVAKWWSGSRLTLIALWAEICLSCIIALSSSQRLIVPREVALIVNPGAGVFLPKGFLSPFFAAVREYLRLDYL